MKSIIFIGILVITAFLSGCYKDNGQESDIPVFSARESVINPPDHFKLIITLREGNITQTSFRDSISSVWEINKQQAPTSIVWLTRTGESDSTFYVEHDTLGLEADVQYQIYGDNDNYYEDRRVHLEFVRLSIDYDSFSNKF